MTKIPRLNGVISALENRGIAFTSFIQMDINAGISASNSSFDGVVFEGEHNPWDPVALRNAMQFMIDRKAILTSKSLAPTVTPIVRIPANGVEQSQWHAKQALDTGVYGVTWPHISSVEEAYNAVAACRYPRLKDAPLYEPKGIRGDGPTRAARYWGLTQQEYYSKADVWPLDKNGEILVIIQIEDTTGISNLSEILKNVPGIGVVLIGEGDLGQELGYPRQYNHPKLLECIKEILTICKQHDVICGHPHADANNMERLLGEGFRFIMTTPTSSDTGLAKGLELAIKR